MASQNSLMLNPAVPLNGGGRVVRLIIVAGTTKAEVYTGGDRPPQFRDVPDVRAAVVASFLERFDGAVGTFRASCHS